MLVRNAALRELLDAETFDEQTLAANLADIRRINALLGWTGFTTREVLRQARRLGPRDISVLDVASGSADIPLRIAHRANHLGIRLHITVSDISPQIVGIAEAACAERGNVRVERLNALALPYADGAYDIGMCTLALHHFDPTDAVTLLSELGRVTRHLLIFDAARSRTAYYGAWLLTRVLGMQPMTRHDAPVSVLRAYNVAELREMAHTAELTDPVVRLTFPFRLALSAQSQRSTPNADETH